MEVLQRDNCSQESTYFQHLVNVFVFFFPLLFDVEEVV